MYYDSEVIRYLQANKILALKLDQAFPGVGKAVSNQIEMVGSGAQRMLYYTSCFTDEYQDICQKQKTEDMRFRQGIVHLIQHGNVVFDMLQIYFEEIFKYRTTEQLEHIKKILMAVNIHIAASSLTNLGFALAAASLVVVGTNLGLNMSVITGRVSGTALSIAGVYGIVQKAADSANRLHYIYPAYYSALYSQELEMMFFLIEPLFERADAFNAQCASDGEIADIIKKMVQ